MSAPIATANNVLANLACPVCTKQRMFTAVTVTLATLTDDGVDDYREPEWVDDAMITCADCQATGTIDQFTVRPGDVLLTEDEVENLIECAGFGISYWAETASRSSADRTYRVTESSIELADDETPITKTLSYTDLRRAFNDLRTEGALPAFMLREIAEGDMCFDAYVGDIVVQKAMFGKVVYG